jgi:TonB family protein
MTVTGPDTTSKEAPVTTRATAATTANDRLKQSFRGTLAVSLVLATVIHVFIFVMWPEMGADNWATEATAIVETLRLDEIDIPPEPKPMSRPAAPVISNAVSAEETIPVIGFSDYAKLLPPPDTPTTDGERAAEAFTPYTVPPRLRNAAEVQRALERAYPPALRDAGLGGTVNLMVHIDAEGTVLEARVGQSSGYEPLDAAALSLSDMMRFSPAMNRDIFVAVWIQIPLTFRVR